ncbi:hypothetical protein K493DRAFT_308147 [Basidiobolus meristosporus CBS 931.73]|uniref:FAD dependent oxidoreductase domain-containing protein n=1 Tax=Basidiobolus meristosporus CBS 931.73 TaxID=1314790 RepID=A0A1Y1X7A6_9FUNG|nr:hypothetical protein K493DRAFT_308147 [Basidiobolus meristosporus CBS 931.73]|eukprot:ORX81224.1 hypothetical protein K493DRAFT_308147 [Basidiobolus meristosporus CBS 931.73]
MSNLRSYQPIPMLQQGETMISSKADSWAIFTQKRISSHFEPQASISRQKSLQYWTTYPYAQPRAHGNEIVSKIAGALWEWPPAVCGSNGKDTKEQLEDLKTWSQVLYIQLKNIANRYGAKETGIHGLQKKHETKSVCEDFNDDLSHLIEKYRINTNLEKKGYNIVDGSKQTLSTKEKKLKAEEGRFKFIVPRNDNILILGGYAQMGQEALEWDEENGMMSTGYLERMRAGCVNLYPNLAAEFTNYYYCAGIWPFCDEPCVGQDELNPRLFHNYGHGGSGFTLSYACALDTCQIVKSNFKTEFRPTSNL